MPEPTTGVKADKERKAPNASSARGRSRLRTGTTRATSQPSPTRSIEPGIVHYKIAEGILRGVRDRAEQAGINLDVGEFPDADADAAISESDPARLVRTTAHAVARIGDRFTLVRKLSRHMEGQDKRSGIFSDLFAVLTELYRRNPEAFEQLGKQAADDFKTRRMQRAEAKEPTTNNGGVTPNASR